MSAALVGIYLDGMSPVGATLLGLGVFLRVVWLGVALRPVSRRRFAQANEPPSRDPATPPPLSP